MGTSLNIEFLHLRIISTEAVIVNESYNAKKIAFVICLYFVEFESDPYESSYFC